MSTDEFEGEDVEEELTGEDGGDADDPVIDFTGIGLDADTGDDENGDGDVGEGSCSDEVVELTKHYVEAVTGIEHTVDRDGKEYQQGGWLLESPVTDVVVKTSEEAYDGEITFASLGCDDRESLDGTMPDPGPRTNEQMREVIEEHGREDITPASELEDESPSLDVHEIEPRAAEEIHQAMALGAFWHTAKEAYEAAASSAHVSKADARMAAVEALEDECEWMSVRWPDDDAAGHDLRWYDADRGEWRTDAAARVADRMVGKLGSHATDTECRHVMHFLNARHPVPSSVLNAADDDRVLIPVQNGVLDLTDVEYDADTMSIDLDSVELIDADPEFRFTYRIDTPWDPDGADVEGFDEWLESITRDDAARRVIAETAGHAVHPAYPTDGFFVALGEPGSGKSQVLNVIEATLGARNTSGIDLQKLETNRFAANDMVENQANINTDLSGVKLKDMSDLKKAAAGEGLTCEEKGVQGNRKKENRATLIFAADNPPAFPQSDKALGRRLQCVEFPASYERNPDPSNPWELQHRPKLVVERELQADDRLKACLVRAVEGLVRLLNEGEFTSGRSWEERVEMYETFADPIADFGRAALERDPNGPGVAADDIKAAYDAYAEIQNHPDKEKSTIMKMLGRFTWTKLDRSRPKSWTPGSSKTTIYKGMKFTEFAKKELLPEDAFWEKYGGRPDADDGEENDEPMRTMVADLQLGRENVKAKVEYVMDDPKPWLAGEGVLRDRSGTVRYEIPEEFALKEDETYVIEDAVVTSAEGDDVKMQLVPGMTNVILIDSGDRDDDQETVTEDDAGEENGDENESGGDDRKDVAQRKRYDAVREAVRRADDGESAGADVNTVVALAAGQTVLEFGTIESTVESMVRDGELHEPTEGRVRLT